jgi:ElaB/YqjD/DUF883 family membrane-anchored ribosome-binding protein
MNQSAAARASWRLPTSALLAQTDLIGREQIMRRSPSMPKSFRDVRYNLEDSLEDIAKSLRTAAEGLSGDASEAVSKAAEEATRAAKSVREYAAGVSRKAAHRVQEHPIVSLAAAITAAAALVALIIVATRHRYD